MFVYIIISVGNFVVLKYTDDYSVENNSLRDVQIGFGSRLVGSNKAIGKNKHVFVKITVNGTKHIAYCGITIGRVRSVNPWRDAGGHEWKYIYSTNGDNSELCEEEKFGTGLVFLRKFMMFGFIPPIFNDACISVKDTLFGRISL